MQPSPALGISASALIRPTDQLSALVTTYTLPTHKSVRMFRKLDDGVSAWVTTTKDTQVLVQLSDLAPVPKKAKPAKPEPKEKPVEECGRLSPELQETARAYTAWTGEVLDRHALERYHVSKSFICYDDDCPCKLTPAQKRVRASLIRERLAQKATPEPFKVGDTVVKKTEVALRSVKKRKPSVVKQVKEADGFQLVTTDALDSVPSYLLEKVVA
jgi:hypothetical protein